MSGLLETGSVKDIVLSQDGQDTVLRVKKVRDLSALYDLALLETEETVTHFLKVNETPPESTASLFIPAYPQGNFKKIEKTRDFSYKDNYIYELTVNHSDLSGVSGSPVLDERDQVVGLSSLCMSTLFAIKPSYLKELIEGEIGLTCSNFENVESCVEKAIMNLGELSEKGHPFTQYRLGCIYFERVKRKRTK